MPLTRIDSAFLDLDAIGGIDFDVQSGVPTFSVDAVNHRVGIGTDSPTTKLEVIGDITVSKQNAFIELKDPDTADANYRLRNQGGSFSIYDVTNNQVKIAATAGYVTIYPNLNANNGLDVMGTITGDGNLDIADGIRHYGDTNTSISFPADDTITAETGGTERLRITSSGRIGIGTDSPAKILDVLTPAGGRIQFDKAGIDGSRILFTNPDGTARATINNFGGSNETLQLNAPSKIDLAINGAEKVRLDANGRLLVGTLSSSGDHILQVNSGTDNEGIKVVSTDAGSYIRFADNSTTAQTRLGAVGDDFKIDVNSGERFRIDSNGKIGIGTDSLQARFTVYSADNNVDTREIRIDASNAPSGSVSVGIFKILGDGNSLGKYIIGYNSTHPSQANDVSLKNSDGDISFHTAVNATPAEKVRITTTGRVGINEPNPAYTLDLGESASTIRLVSENNGTAIRVGAGGGSNDVTLIRVDGDANNNNGESDSAQYGFSLKYLGSGSQNANAFAIFSDNQTGTQVQAFTVLQDGTVGINGNVNVGGSAGAVGTKFNILNGSDNQNILGITGADESSEYAAIGVSGGNAVFTGGGAGTTSTGIIFRTAASGTETERVRITSDGSVGIGTVSAEHQLTVFNNGYTGVTIKSSRTNATSNIGGLDFKTQNTTVARIQSFVDGSIRFRNTSSLLDRLRITPTGNVGIGVIDPECKLQVGGDLQVGDSNNPGTFINVVGAGVGQNFGIRFGGGSNNPESKFSILGNTNDGHMRFRFGGTEKFRIRSDGKFGFGTGGNIDERGHIETASGNCRLKLQTGNTAVAGFVLQTSAKRFDIQAQNNFFQLYDSTVGTDRIRIDSDGDVGVGIADPQERLHVARIVMITGNTPQIRLNANDSDASDGDRTMLGQATGNGNFVTTAVDNDTILRGTSTGNLLFGIGTAEKFRITSSGNVGIGTNNPASKLSNSATAVSDGTQSVGSNGLNWKTSNSNAYIAGFENQSTGNGALFRVGDDNSARKILHAMNGSGSTVFLARGDGNVGLGTNSPGGKLHVESAATTAGWQIRTDSVGLSNESGFYRDASDHYEVVIRNGLGGLSYVKNDGGASTANLRFNVQGGERLTILSSGNVGIGTNNPVYPLHVQESAYFRRGIQVAVLSSNELQSRSPINSGFYNVDNTTTANGWPFTGWAHLLANTHSNTTNYYSQQFASSFYNQELYFRNTNSSGTSTTQSWGQVMHTNSALKPVFAESSGVTDAYSRYWYPGGEYYVSVHGITAPGDANNMIEQGYYHIANNTSNNPTSAYGYLNVHRHAGSQYSLQHFIVSSDTGRQWMRASYPDGSQSSGRNWYQWYSYGALERENTFTNRQHIIGPSSTSTFTGLHPNTSNNRAQFVLHSNYSDLVISSSQNNNNHGSTLSFVTQNPSNTADYNKFVINKGNYGTRNQFLEFGFIDNEYTNPHDYVNSTNTAVTIDGNNKRLGIGPGARTPGYPLDVRFAGDSGIHASSSNSHCSLFLNASTGNGSYIRMSAGGNQKFWIATDGSGHLNFRPNAGGTTIRMQNGGKLDAFAGIYVSGASLTLANTELDFTTANHKYIDFYTNNGNTVNFRMPNNSNVFHTGIQMVKAGAVNLYHNNTVKFYTTSTGTFTNGIQGSSDARLKTNVITVPNALDKVRAMRGVKFNWIEDGRADYGVIAQEAETVVPELVGDHETKKLTQAGSLKKRPDDSDYITTTEKGFSYMSMVGILIEAIKEQQATIDSLTARIDALENP
ncbi:virion structural protein [Cyanophage S-TIM66]|nr:virion structural protein [Cyanophage S-TIM66]